ncbi:MULTISPECIES: DUF3261 domain-containing protein [unclassified Vibrio]|uniref:DUF3261 domain-containing protein n=1 Tax=unclassified Vibrio TaxID=2614977 RepID=UPI000C81A1B2|nr:MULTISPECIES: DUF3261 domain-containing protein [unclassified Vibrio]PMI21477.1 hypothetical protein BCU50_14650 [Vibrio sp. 10N.286.46.E10]PMI87629.1 hypothetical protein BCU34_05395 [Vibrio sp. 10N.286.45.E10]PTP10916.1 DUF3261 domain-containing protein [Vibrio sp. 10N.286.45.A3]PTQ22848.1 DUF3261 domain-containing protein [Vibrio sp. 10N.286.46.E10]TKE81782.1 DUF3261 domain-containing protein [Vibrio sp. F12]
MIQTLKVTFAMLVGILMSACSMVSQQPSGASVSIDQDTELALPLPAELGYSLTASQLIGATWENDTQQLPVQVEVTPGKVVLAGFSSWGTRILSLQYQNQAIETQVLSGLGATLPQPEQVLFNLMLTLWPAEAWAQPLQGIGWHLVDTDKTRTVFDDNQQAIIRIEYQAKVGEPKTSGEIVFKHLIQGYNITIQTLNSTIVDNPSKS